MSDSGLEKHVFWGVVVLVLAVLAAYVGLTLADHEQAAARLASGAGTVAVVAVLVWIFL